MGSSGMKRKGRKHLPKAGTRPSNEAKYHDERTEHAHPFSSDPWDEKRSNVGAIVMGVVILFVVAAVVGLILI